VEEKGQIEQGGSPFHPPDDRLLAFELKRPEVFLGETVEDLIGDEELSAELRQRVSDMPFASQQYLLKCLKGRNANVVDHPSGECGPWLQCVC